MENSGTQLNALDEKIFFVITRIWHILPERSAKVDESNGKQPRGPQMPSYYSPDTCAGLESVKEFPVTTSLLLHD
jgi:hypothetical protein